jgi:hypothetical protein
MKANVRTATTPLTANAEAAIENTGHANTRDDREKVLTPLVPGCDARRCNLLFRSDLLRLA